MRQYLRSFHLLSHRGLTRKCNIKLLKLVGERIVVIVVLRCADAVFLPLAVGRCAIVTIHRLLLRTVLLVFFVILWYLSRLLIGLDNRWSKALLIGSLVYHSVDNLIPRVVSATDEGTTAIFLVEHGPQSTLALELTR